MTQEQLDGMRSGYYRCVFADGTGETLWLGTDDDTPDLSQNTFFELCADGIEVDFSAPYLPSNVTRATRI